MLCNSRPATVEGMLKLTSLSQTLTKWLCLGAATFYQTQHLIVEALHKYWHQIRCAMPLHVGVTVGLSDNCLRCLHIRSPASYSSTQTSEITQMSTCTTHETSKDLECT